MRKILAYIILALSLIIIYGSLAISLSFKSEYEITPSILLFSLLFNVVIMVIPAILFVYLMYGKVWEMLYFRKTNLLKSVLYGCLATALFIFASAAVITLSGYEENNPLAEEIGKNINLPLLLLVPLLSAFTEEIYFRGLLQMQMEKKNVPLAIIISALLFSLAHLEYGVAIQLIMPFAFGMVLGIVMHFSRNIMAPFTAHFLYNFISLATFLYD